MSFPYLSDLAKALTGYDLPLPIPIFGLLVACAILVGGACLTAELRRLHGAHRLGNAKRPVTGKDGTVSGLEIAPHDIVSNLTMAVFLSGLVGARVFHIFEHMDSFLADPWEMIFTRFGFSVFGGLIFGTIAGLVFIKRWSPAGAADARRCRARYHAGLRDRAASAARYPATATGEAGPTWRSNLTGCPHGRGRKPMTIMSSAPWSLCLAFIQPPCMKR